MDDVIQLMLLECKDMFVEFADGCDDEDYKTRFGVYPSSAIIKYYDIYSIDSKIGKPLRSWKLENNFVAELTDSTIEPPTAPISGMYYPEGLFCFEINLQIHTAHLAMRLGRLYWRGFEYDIDNQDGQIALINKKLSWVS